MDDRISFLFVLLFFYSLTDGTRPTQSPEYIPETTSVNWIPSSEIERVHKVGDGGYAKVYKSLYSFFYYDLLMYSEPNLADTEINMWL